MSYLHHVSFVTQTTPSRSPNFKFSIAFRLFFIKSTIITLGMWLIYWPRKKTKFLPWSKSWQPTWLTKSFVQVTQVFEKISRVPKASPTMSNAQNQGAAFLREKCWEKPKFNIRKTWYNFKTFFKSKFVGAAAYIQLSKSPEQPNLQSVSAKFDWSTQKIFQLNALGGRSTLTRPTKPRAAKSTWEISICNGISWQTLSASPC